MVGAFVTYGRYTVKREISLKVLKKPTTRVQKLRNGFALLALWTKQFQNRVNLTRGGQLTLERL